MCHGVTPEQQFFTLLAIHYLLNGFVEFKAKDLINRVCIVHTQHCNLCTNYTCGLPQGLDLYNSSV